MLKILNCESFSGYISVRKKMFEDGKFMGS